MNVINDKLERQELNSTNSIYSAISRIELEQRLQSSEFKLLCANLSEQIVQIDHLSQELPQLLKQLSQRISVQNQPELCLVMCFPFSQECFIYHTFNRDLSNAEIRLLQKNLLTSSDLSLLNKQVEYAEWMLDQHHIKLLNIEKEYVLWRVYLDYAQYQNLNQPQLQLLDESLQYGFEKRAALNEKIQDILQQERREFSADLHDSIAQILGFLRLKSVQLNQICHQNQQYSALSSQTEELATYTHYAYQQTRELITASRLIYQGLDFSDALKKVIEEFEVQSSIVFELDNRVTRFPISAKQSVQLLYIIRESLSNVVRHSHATHARVFLECAPRQQLKIKIFDDGRGIDLQKKRSDSFGLQIMQERAERIGAELTIAAQKPQGTCITVHLNLN